MHALHKNLDWLSRYLFDVSGLPFGPPIAMIDVAREPFRWRNIRGQVTTVVGANVIDVVTPADRQRLYCWGSLSATAGMTLGDDLGCGLIVDGLFTPIWSYNNIQASELNGPWFVVRGRNRFSGTTVESRGGAPILAPPGSTLRFDIAAAAAGAVVTWRSLAIDLPEYAPFPPVF